MRKLYFGCTGSDVKELQMKLESLGYADFSPTTTFGIKTHLALRKFQLDHKLPATGIFGTTEASLMGIVETKTRSEQFFDFCMQFVGTDVTPQDQVPDEVACMVTIDTLYKKFTGNYLNNTLTESTFTGMKVLTNHPAFIRSTSPVKGTILVYATGTGNGSMIGHIFICDGLGNLWSNSSATGLFTKNYTKYTAAYRYETHGGFKPNYFTLM